MTSDSVSSSGASGAAAQQDQDGDGAQGSQVTPDKQGFLSSVRS